MNVYDKLTKVVDSNQREFHDCAKKIQVIQVGIEQKDREMQRLSMQIEKCDLELTGTKLIFADEKTNKFAEQYAKQAQ